MRGKVKKNGRDRRSGRSFGDFSCVRSGIDKLTLQRALDVGVSGKRGMPMNTMEVLTLLLVVFAALSYIDGHYKKK